jgi:hypothetical protein
MDRLIIQPGAVPLDTDLLNAQRWAMIQTGYLAQAMLGTGTIVDGLALNPTAPASLTVTVGPGAIYQLATIDANDFGSLSADNASPLVKVGINAVGSTSFTLTAPSSSGQSINYLIEASLQESDSVPLVLPYFNPSNPAQPYSGPNNTGATVNTQRVQRVQLQLKAGAAANTGSQTTPSVDNGWVGLYVITVNFGQSQITSGNLTGAKLATAPFIPAKLGPGMLPGFSNSGSFGPSGTLGSTGTTNWTVPSGVIKVRVRCWGGGGGGAGSTSGQGGGGGGGGAYAEGIYSVTPGAVIAVTAAAGGLNGGPGAAGSSGGTSSFGTYCSATGGSGGAASGSYAGGSGGTAAGGTALNLNGAHGSGGITGTTTGLGGTGGGAPMGGSGDGSSSGTPGLQPGSPGGGGAGAGGGSANSGSGGAAGIVIVEW